MISVEFDAREVEWEFAQGRKVRGFAYNGQVPGPLIEAQVGDEVEVRLRNSLPQATTIHWHGLRVPAHMDGTEAVQAPVEKFDELLLRARGLERLQVVQRVGQKAHQFLGELGLGAAGLLR